MSYAIYAESEGYVHLVSDHRRNSVILLLKQDLEGVGVKMHELTNVFAVCGKSEDIELEDEVNQLIEIAKIKEGE